MPCLPDGPIPAKIMIVGEAPGADEEIKGIPFVGTSGQELNRMLQEAGLTRSECFVTNVCRIRPPKNDISLYIAKSKKEITPKHIRLRSKWVLPPIVEGFNLLQKELIAVQPNIIIALGNVAMWALTGQWGIMRMRGSMLLTDFGEQPYKVIPTIHPAAILRQWDMRATAVLDLRRAARFRGGLPYPIPNYKFILRPSFQQAIDTLSYIYRLIEAGPHRISFDIETSRSSIDCAGLAWSATESICIPFVEVLSWKTVWTLEEESQLVYWFYLILTHKNARVVGQNILYDSQYTYRYWHFTPHVTQDTMISHHVAFAGLPKKLDFQASMYCDYYIQWKPDRSKQKEGG